MKRLLLLLLIITSCFTPSKAVLTEKNLGQTLEVLNVELNSTFSQLRTTIALIQKFSDKQHMSMIATMQRSNQIALMLYSQNYDYTFNLAYACHEAAEQYFEFTQEVMPYDKIMNKLDLEIMRYTRLIETLQELPPSLTHKKKKLSDSIKKKFAHLSKEKVAPFILDERGQINRKTCLLYARAIVKEIQILRDELSEDSQHYQRLQKRLKTVFDYAQVRYHNIQKNIFINGDDNYFTIASNLPMYSRRAAIDWKNKYNNDLYASKHVKSEWRGPIVFGLVFFVTFYFVIAFLLSNLIVRLLMKKVKRFQQKDIRLKTNSIISASSFALFAVAIMIVRIFLKHNFIIMASQLLVSFAWLAAVILISLIIRLSGHEIRSALKIYMPIIMLGFIVIVFRIIFIPNSVVALIFPPLLIVFTIWQFIALLRENHKVPLSDKVYSWISFALMVTACIMALTGFVLMSVQTFIWWLIQLTLIQTITCIYDWVRRREQIYLQYTLKLKNYEISHSVLKRDGKYIQHSWLFDLLGMMVIPLSAIFSVLIAIYSAADVFDLTEICINVFYAPIINVTGICHCSIFKLVLVICIFFVFNYISYVTKAAYLYLRHKHIARKNKGIGISANQANISLFNNLISILIWGIYLIAVLSILDVPKSGLSLVSAGLATGVGFAMKSLIENFFYGISLMTGRLRTGDWIECEGVRGTVDSITYQSTQIITSEGQVITFMNSTLFNQNFKNLTRNHLYEMSKITIGVAYGSNIAQVRQLLTDAVKSVMRKGKSGRDIMNSKKGVSVLVKNFGDSSIDLLVVYWALVEERIVFDCQVREAIYNVLNEHHVEIPFPQRDIHFRSNLFLESETVKKE